MASRKESKRGGGDKWTPLLPVPEDAPSPEALIVRLVPKDHTFAAAYDYRNEAGLLLCGVVRFNSTKDPEPGKKRDKQFRPFTFCEGPNGAREWRAKSPPEPRPLYGLDLLAARPDAPVLLCEGEKKADAARELFPSYVAVSSMSGSKSAANADWSPAAGRQWIIWPDNDKPGAEYASDAAAALYAAGAASVSVVRLPEGLPKEWCDLADGIPDGFTEADLRSWLEAAEEVPPPVDPLEGLVERVKDDPGAAFEPEVVEALAALRASDSAAFERLRAEIKKAGARVAALDKELRAAGGDESGQGRPLDLPEPTPWREPVEGAELLDSLVAAIKRHVALAEGAAEAVALWAVHTHLAGGLWITPRLGITSPEKRCGKTTLLDVLARLVFRPLTAANISAAGVFRVIESTAPTLLMDEADTFLRENKDLRGVLNSGHSRTSAYVIRCDGESFEPRQFNTFAPVAIAAIGQLPATLTDRSVVIAMRRAMPNDRIVRLRSDRAPHLDRLAQKIARWAADNAETVRGADPDVPDVLHARAADNWRPLLAIADLAGGEWPERARHAAVILSSDAAADDQSSKVQLLSDLRDLFVETRAMRLETGTILERLHDMPTRPWCEWMHGKPMTARQLAQALAPFKVAPVQWKDGYGRGRGYTFADLREAFDRYLSSDGQQSGGRLVPDGGCPVPGAVPDVAPAKTEQKQRGPGCPAFSGGCEKESASNGSGAPEIEEFEL